MTSHNFFVILQAKPSKILILFTTTSQLSKTKYFKLIFTFKLSSYNCFSNRPGEFIEKKIFEFEV